MAAVWSAVVPMDTPWSVATTMLPAATGLVLRLGPYEVAAAAVEQGLRLLRRGIDEAARLLGACAAGEILIARGPGAQVQMPLEPARMVSPPEVATTDLEFSTRRLSSHDAGLLRG